MYRAFFTFITALFAALQAAGSTPTNNLIVDQLGWRASAPQKMAVIANPQSGQNAPHAIAPGTTFELKRSSDNATVYSGALSTWNGGATDASSGDKAWWADFSSFSTPGSYYLYNAPSAQSSYPFQINDSVYRGPLDAVLKFYFYQRCGGNISAANGGVWNHAACHLGANQDLTAQLWYGGAAHGQPKDVSGGWHDAGDYGKYVEFVPTSVWNLLYAYEQYPSRFGDATNIPESGNGVPDILDEAKWELDWLLKMQNADGSVASKIGITAYEQQTPPNGISPPPPNRYYTLSSTAAASTMAALCAYGSRIFAPYAVQYPGYAAQLSTAAQNAWTWLAAHPAQILSDNTGLVNATTDVTAAEDACRRVWAACELYATTGSATYKAYVDANYNVAAGAQNPISGNNFVPCENWTLEAGLVSYATAAGATAGVVTAIKTALKNGMTNQVMPNDLSDPYRAFVWDWHYYWGSNQQKGTWGEFCLWAVNLNVNPAQNTAYLTKAEEYIHYFHGRNPLSWVYITGMQAFGASKVVGQIYHGWFKDLSLLYDGYPPLSTYGPAPGIMPGGVNRATTGGISPPTGEPYQKAYKDWNTGWPENSWEVTEPDQGYTGPYLVLCAAFAPPAGTPTPTPSVTPYAGSPSPSVTLTKSPTQAAPSPTDSPAATSSVSPTPSSTPTVTPFYSATLTVSATRTPLAVNNCPRVSMMFYPSWLGGSYPSSTIPYSKLTHIAYAFASILPGGTLNMPAYNSTLIGMAHASGVKVLLSVGGAGSDLDYRPMIASAVSRTAFADSVEANLRSAGYDGVDIDYEFPKNAADRSNLNLMIQALRAKFAASAAPAPAWLITGDLSQDQYYGQWWDVATLKNYMNYFNIMVYDMYGSWNTKAGHNAPLRDSTLPNSDPNYSGAYSVFQYSTVRGVPPAQILYGLAFYGYRYPAIENIYDSCGGPCTGGASTPYSAIAPLVGAGWTRSYDASSDSVYLRYNAGPGLYAYDDVQSITAKASWAVAQGLGGVFAWEISNDRMGDGTEPLLDAAWAAVQCVMPTATISPTFSVSPTALGSFTPTPTSSPSPSATPTMTPALSGPLIVSTVLPAPNPNPVALSFFLQGPADEIQLRIYGPGCMLHSRVVSGHRDLGWNSVPLDPEFRMSAPNGVYFYVLAAKRGALKSDAFKGKLYILK